MMNQQETMQAEPSVSIYLPPEGNGAFVEGAINGVNFRVRTGTVVEVPAHIAAVLMDSRRALAAGEQAVRAFAAAGGKPLGGMA